MQLARNWLPVVGPIVVAPAGTVLLSEVMGTVFLPGVVMALGVVMAVLLAHMPGGIIGSTLSLRHARDGDSAGDAQADQDLGEFRHGFSFFVGREGMVGQRRS